MTPPDYTGYRFPSDVIQRAVWMYLRFTRSYRDVEDLLAERGVEVSYETIRRWVTTFGPVIARRLRTRRPVPHRRWHLDEMFVQIGGKQMYLWRAVDAEGEVLEVLVQARRDAVAARKLMRKLLRKQGIAPTAWVTDKCPAYGAALVICGSTAYPTYGPSGKTTGPRARTFRFDDASGSDKDLNRPPRHSGSCRFMPPPTTHSMSAVTSPPPAHTGSFEPRRLRHGVMRLASQPEHGECGPHRGHARQCDKPIPRTRCSSIRRMASW
jgi:transposase-like protein